MNDKDAKAIRRVLEAMASEESVQDSDRYPAIDLERTTDVAHGSMARRMLVPAVAAAAVAVGGVLTLALGSGEPDLASGAASTSESSLPPESLSTTTSTLAEPPSTTVASPTPSENVPTSPAPITTTAPVVEPTLAPSPSVTEAQGQVSSPDSTIDLPVGVDSMPPGAIPAPAGVGGPTTVAVAPVPENLAPAIERFVSVLPAGYVLTESGGNGDGAFAKAVNESTNGVLTLSITRQSGAPQTGEITRSDGLERRAIAGSDGYAFEVVATNKTGESPESNEVVTELAVAAANG